MTSRPAEQLLPEPRRPGAPYRIAVVCLGNICRSPMAEVILSHKLERAGLDRDVEVVSAGIGGWHVGDPMDRRAATVLTAHGYDASRHRAQQFDASWHDEYDLILTMDSDNEREVAATVSSPDQRSRVRMFRDFDPRADTADKDVPDPYFGGSDGFDTVLTMVERTATAIVAALETSSEVSR